MPIQYEANRKAWVTAEIFEKWLFKLDQYYHSKNRKIVLFIDNCPAHPKLFTQELLSVKYVFFPPNVTSKLQPMDQGIIQNFKQIYRKRIIKKTLEMAEKKITPEINLLHCL